MSYSRQHYRLIAGGSNAPEAVAERLRYKAIRAQAFQEMHEQYPTITPANAEAALEWMAARIVELLRGSAP